MPNETLENEYLTELHALLRVFIKNCINAYGGEHEFVNDHIVNGSIGEYGSADSDSADGAVKAFHAINKLLPRELLIEFNCIYFDESMEVVYVFNLLRGDDSYTEIFCYLTFKMSQSAMILDKHDLEHFRKHITDEELQSMLTTVKKEATFGFMKNS